MKVLNVSWNGSTDVTRITYSNDFKEADWLIKLDVLQDLIGEMTNHYNAMLGLDWKTRESYNFSEIED